MNFEELFSQYRTLTEGTDTLFTIVAHSMTPHETIECIISKLLLAKEMRPSKKKSLVCERLNKLITYLNEYEIKEVNSVFLISESVIDIPIKDEWNKVIIEYDINKFIFKYSMTFEIDYLKTLLTDTTYRDVILIENNKYSHIYLSHNKKKVHFHKTSRAFDLVEYINKNIKDKCVIHGVSGILKQFKCESHWVFTHKLTDNEIFDVYRKDDMGKIHIELDKYLSYIHNDKFTHRLVFGKDVQKKIFQRELKILFCSPEKYQLVTKKLPSEYLTSNFNIYMVDTLNHGDVGDRLKIEFGGVLGITYF